MVYLARFLRFVVGSRLEPVVLPLDSLCNFRATARPAGVTSPLDGCISVPPVEKLILFKVVEGRRVLRADVPLEVSFMAFFGGLEDPHRETRRGIASSYAHRSSGRREHRYTFVPPVVHKMVKSRWHARISPSRSALHIQFVYSENHPSDSAHDGTDTLKMARLVPRARLIQDAEASPSIEF